MKAKKKQSKIKTFVGRFKILFKCVSLVKSATRKHKKGPTYNYAVIGKEIVKILGM